METYGEALKIPTIIIPTVEGFYWVCMDFNWVCNTHNKKEQLRLCGGADDRIELGKRENRQVAVVQQKRRFAR